MRILGPALMVVALLIGICGMAEISRATSGVGLVAMGCLVGILARLVQAEVHHRELGQLLAKRDGSAD